MMNTVNQDVWDAREFLAYCAQTHPKAQIADYIKRLYQSEFGGSHRLRRTDTSLEGLQQEVEKLTGEQLDKPYFDPFCGSFCRMNLSISKLLSVGMMNRIFEVSAQSVPKGAWVRFEEKLRLFWELCRDRPELFPFTEQQVREYLTGYEKAGYPLVCHSPEYVAAYAPAYRVVRKEYGRYPEIYAAMERCLREKDSVNVAIDGNCGSGKTAAAKLLASLFDCNVFHTDDFFLPREKRTPERLQEVGGNMDRERFRREVCEPLKTGKPFSYQRFDCAVMEMGDAVEVQPKRINIFEGAYCMHPDLREYYDVTVFLSVPRQVQEARILERNGSFMLRRFLEEWIPKENAYFDEMKVREASELVY